MRARVCNARYEPSRASPYVFSHRGHLLHAGKSRYAAPNDSNFRHIDSTQCHLPRRRTIQVTSENGAGSPSIRLDAQVTTAVLEIIEQATKFVALVSPYLDSVPRVERELKLAQQRNVRVLVAVRKDEGKVGGGNGQQAIDRLQSEKIDVRTVPWLHSKVYLNESQALVSSMNLLNSS